MLCTYASLTIVKANHKIIKPSKTLKIHITYDTANKQTGYTEQSIILCLEGSKNPIYFVLKATHNIEQMEWGHAQQAKGKHVTSDKERVVRLTTLSLSLLLPFVGRFEQ